MDNQRLIAEVGLLSFLEQQERRMAFLHTALESYNDGRNKNFYCLAATLLSVDGLDKAMVAAESGENLRAGLTTIAQDERQELKLRK